MFKNWNEVLETEEQDKSDVYVEVCEIYEEICEMVQKQEDMGYRVRVIEVPPNMYKILHKKLLEFSDTSICGMRLFGCDVRLNENIDEPRPGVKYFKP